MKESTMVRAFSLVVLLLGLVVAPAPGDAAPSAKVAGT